MRIAIALVVLAACGSKESDKARRDDKARPADPGSAPKGPPPLANVSVRFSGKQVAMQRAFIKRIEPDRYQVYLTTGPGSCQELLDNVFGSGDRVDVLATISPRLNADGKQYFQVIEVHEGAPTMEIGPGARVRVTGAAAKDEPAEVELDFSAAAKEPTAGGLTIEVRGKLTAEGCGARPRDPAGLPRAQHPMGATLTIANQRLEIKGAIVRGGGKERDVMLSTGPKDCSSSTPWAEVILERVGGTWRASGTWLEREARAAGKTAFAVGFGATGTSDDGPTVQLALSGEGNLGGYAISLEGTTEAIACKP